MSPAGIARAALDTTSSRFAALQQLINAIPSATDAKGVLDLQARIAAEQAMLANDATELGVLRQTLAAEDAALEGQRRERAVADIGSLRTLAPMGVGSIWRRRACDSRSQRQDGC